MKISLQTKLTLGTAFLFALLVCTAGLGLYAVRVLRTDARQVLRDNYESLHYVQQMQHALDQQPLDRVEFESALRQQEANVTEPGEDVLTQRVRALYAQRDSAGAWAQAEPVRTALLEIARVNMEAIQQKNTQALETASKAQFSLTLLAAVVLLIGFTFAVNFPSLIATPVARLNEAIREITARNYAHRIRLDTGDEFSALAGAINEMSVKLDEYEHSNLARLMQEKARAEAVINSLSDASIGIDPAGVILFANPQALLLLGLRAEDLTGKPAAEVARHNDLLRMLLDPAPAQAFRVVVNAVEGFYTRDLLPISGENGLLGNLLVIRNITAFQEKDIARTNFIATISHELKTPLASADLGLKLLERDTAAFSAQQREILAALRQDNQRLIRLVSELLDLSQAETGHLHLRPDVVSLDDIVLAATGTLKQQADAKSLRIATQLPEALPPLYADREKAIWVMVNVLSNAVKFSPPRSEIRIGATVQGDEVVCTVEDQGPGVPPELREEVFGRFFTRGGRGTGLGLYIARQFMQAMEGGISLEGEAGARVVMRFRKAVFPASEGMLENG